MEVVVCGAGPIGLETARQCVLWAQHHTKSPNAVSITVIERGERSCNHIRKWQEVRMFSTYRLNIPKQQTEVDMSNVDLDVCPTGAEFVENYLQPLTEKLQESCVRFLWKTKVVSISRESVAKGDFIGCSAKRAKSRFRLYVLEGNEERYISADMVFDCSGTLDQPNPLGSGGLPALGEDSLRTMSPQSVTYGIPTLRQMGDMPEGYRLAVIGSGYSAATTLKHLCAIAEKRHKNFQIHWLTRHHTSPYHVAEDDVLPDRLALCRFGNSLVEKREHKGCSVQHIGPTTVEKITLNEDRSVVLSLLVKGDAVSITADHIIVNCGYRPDNNLFRELQVHVCWATDGLMEVSKNVLSSSVSSDCLKVKVSGYEALRNPEFRFFVLGSKSYGRLPSFLLKTGYEQVDTVFANLGCP